MICDKVCGGLLSSLFVCLIVFVVVTHTAPSTDWEPQRDTRAAWHPQGRFGKRSDQTETSEQGLLSTDSEFNLEKRWKPQGRFGKKNYSAFSGVTLSNYNGKRMWRPQGRFGKRTAEVEDSIEALKRAAWHPQGRFGKRDSEMMEENHLKRAWRPQGRFGKRSEIPDAPKPSDNDMEYPMGSFQTGNIVCLSVAKQLGIFKCYNIGDSMESMVAETR